MIDVVIYMNKDGELVAVPKDEYSPRMGRLVNEVYSELALLYSAINIRNGCRGNKNEVLFKRINKVYNKPNDVFAVFDYLSRIREKDYNLTERPSVYFGQKCLMNSETDFNTAKHNMNCLKEHLEIKKAKRGKQYLNLFHHIVVSFPQGYLDDDKQKISRLFEIMTPDVFCKFDSDYVYAIHNDLPPDEYNAGRPHKHIHCHVFLRARSKSGNLIHFRRHDLVNIRSEIAHKCNILTGSSLKASLTIDRRDDWEQKILGNRVEDDIALIKHFPKFSKVFAEEYYENRLKGKETDLKGLNLPTEPLDMFVKPKDAKRAIELMMAEELDKNNKKSLTRFYFINYPGVFGQLMYQNSKKTNKANWNKLELSPEKIPLYKCTTIDEGQRIYIFNLILKITLKQSKKTKDKIAKRLNKLQMKTSVNLSDAIVFVEDLYIKRSKQNLPEIIQEKHKTIEINKPTRKLTR